MLEQDCNCVAFKICQECEANNADRFVYDALNVVCKETDLHLYLKNSRPQEMVMSLFLPFISSS